MSEDVYAAAAGPKRRPAHADIDEARRLIAERLDWPDGAVEACENLEHRFRGWCVAWFHEQKFGDEMWHREAGFYAWAAEEQPLVRNSGTGYERRREKYGATVQELERQLFARVEWLS